MAKVSLWTARGEYLEHMRAQGLAASTVTNHGQALSHALNSWGDIDLRDITPAHVDKLFAKRSWSTGTQNLYLLALRGFFRWCRVHSYMPVDSDVTAGWQTRRTPKRQRTWLDVDELGRLLDAAWNPRDRAFIALGCYLFLRGGEIAALTVGDLDFAHDEVDVYRIKGKVADRLPMCTELRAEMTAWLDYYRADQGELCDEWLLVPARAPLPMRGRAGGRGLEPTGAPSPLKPTMPITKPYEIVRRAMRDIGFDTLGDGAHVLRRSGGRNLFQRLRADGHDGALRRVSSMYGHSSVTITEHYLSVDAERRERNDMLAGKPMFAKTA